MTGKRLINYPAERMPGGARHTAYGNRGHKSAVQAPDAERREKRMVKAGSAALLAALEREHPRIVRHLRMKPNAQDVYKTKGSK